MPNIIFNKTTTYSFDNSQLNLEYFDSGDLHGNDNFRTQTEVLTVYEVLQQIDSALLHSAIAAMLDDTPVSLTEKITKDCHLDIITLNDPIGKTIYHQTLAFLMAQSVYTAQQDAQLSALNISQSACTLKYIAQTTPSLESTKQQLQQTIAENAAIQLINGFQKEILLETYPSLSCPYAEAFLSSYDDYDFVTVAARQNFVLPITPETVLVANPFLIKNYTLSIEPTEDGFILKGSYQA